MSKHVADLLVQDKNEEPVAIIAVKNWPGIFSRQEAEETLAILTDYNSLIDIPAPYLLLISKDQAFIWKHAGEPDATFSEFSIQSVVNRYLLETETAGTLSNNQLRWLVLQWLHDLAWDGQSTNGEPEKTLAETGFLEAIKGNGILIEAPIYGRVHRV